MSGTLWQLVHIEVEGDAALQAEETAAAVVLEDRLCRQIGHFAEEHQQVPVQKPGRTAREWLIILRMKYMQNAICFHKFTHFLSQKGSDFLK